MRRFVLPVFALAWASVAGADQTVTVGPGMSFNPAAVTIAPGETVTWTFIAPFHTTTSDATTGPETWDSGIVPVSSSFSHTFNTPGSYPYYCTVHSFPGGTSMNGVVNVTAPIVTTLTSIDPSSGPAAGGTSVALTGENFSAGCASTFDGITAATTFNSPTSLTAITPAHAAGAVDVAVSCSSGSSTLPGAFTYTSTGPAITLINPPAAQPGATVTITGSNFQIGSSVTFNGVAAVINSQSTTSISVIVPAISPGVVTVRVTNPDTQFATSSFTVLASGSIPLFSEGVIVLLLGIIAAIGIARL